MTDMTEHRPVASDADGGDHLVDAGGVVIFLIHETTETEGRNFAESRELREPSDPQPSVGEGFFSLVANKWTRISDREKNMMSNAIDDDIGHSDIKTGMKISDDSKVDDIRL